jgi:hypothetical protein
MNENTINPQNDNIRSFRSKLKIFVELTDKESNLVKIIKIAIIPKPYIPPFMDRKTPVNGLNNSLFVAF